MSTISYKAYASCTPVHFGRAYANPNDKGVVSGAIGFGMRPDEAPSQASWHE
jgi:hypothetical protein